MDEHTSKGRAHISSYDPTARAGNPYGAQCPAGEWLDKLQRYTQASELVIRPNPKKASEPEVAMQAEGERVLRALSPQVQ